MTNRMTRAFALGAAIMLVGAGVAEAQVTKKGAGYQFRMKFTKGKTTKFKINASVPYPGQPKPITVSSTVVQTVTSVTGNVANISGKVGPTILNGNPMTEEPMTTTAKIDTLGKPVGNAGGPVSFTTYPANPVKVGQTWNSTVPLSGIGGGNAAATFKFLGMKTMNGKQVADVAVTVNATGQQRASGTGRLLVLASDGLPLKMDLNLKIIDPQNADKPFVAPISVTRI
jgi:hypothetical protein